MKNNLFYLILLGLFIFLSGRGVWATTWSSTDISYLTGKGYKMPVSPNTELSYDILTLEHASGWKYGDNYFFTDLSQINTKHPDHYTEWAPRISSGKILGYSFNNVINDILFSAQMNVANGSPIIYLYGIGLDLNVPHFKLFSFNLFQRDDKNLKGSTYQLTFIWNLPFKLKENFVFAGFIDFAGKEGSGGNISEQNILAQPQLLWMPLENLGLGIEYQYWKNKFGINNLDESLAQLMMKWSL